MAARTFSTAVVSFGVFEADLRTGELRKCGVKIKIQELPFQALSAFLTHPKEVLTRDELRHALWPDGVYVDFDRGIISAINRLREALNDSAENPSFIETVGRRGYRWIAPVHVSERATNGHSHEVTVKTESGAPSNSKWQRWKYVLAGSLVVAIAGLAVFWVRHRVTVARLDKTSPEGVGAAKPSPDPEAQAFYLQGRYFWEKRTPDALNKAVDSFTQAIVHDPAYAPAYVGLADCYNLLREYTLMPSSEAYPRALAAAKKAVELDPKFSQAHASLAFVSFYGMWDAATADREFRRAIELEPTNAIAHHWYATFLACLRRYPESLIEIDRAQALDPASKSVLADKGALLFQAGHRDEAFALLKQIEESEPDFISPHRYLKVSYLLTEQYPAFLVEARKEAVLLHDSSATAVTDAAARAFRNGGREGLFEVLTSQEKMLCDRGVFSPVSLAQTYAIGGKKREALRYLSIAYERHIDGVEQIESDRSFDLLNDEPAFRQLLKQMNLPAVR